MDIRSENIGGLADQAAKHIKFARFDRAIDMTVKTCKQSADDVENAMNQLLQAYGTNVPKNAEQLKQTFSCRR